MKKMLNGMNILILLALLSVTNSLYVEGSEIFIIYCSTILFSIVLLSKKDNFFKLIGKAATNGFFFFFLFGSLDMLIDHYLYYFPNGKEDGILLTLEFKLDEYKDTLFLLSLLSMAVIPFLAFVLTCLYSVLSRKKQIKFKFFEEYYNCWRE